MFKSRFLVISVILGMLLSACAGTVTSYTPSPVVASIQSATTAPTEALTLSSNKSLTSSAAVTPLVPSTGVIDWMGHEFETVLVTQTITATTPITITSNSYSIQVPAKAFSENVTFRLLRGDPANFQSKVPSGQTPILAFAFGVKNARGQLIGKFNNPVVLTIHDARITPGSKYYNVAPDGSLTPNPTGMQVKAGELSHPIAGTGVAWVVTSPSSANAAQGLTLQVATNPTLGKILVNNTGRTLYAFKNDSPGQSNCMGVCATIWPPLTIPRNAKPTVGTGGGGLLGVLQRADGSYQVTYNGAPLYLYSGDPKAGQANGQGFNNLWFVVPAG